MDRVIPLLASVAARDAGAFERCLDRYGRLVWSLARRLSPTRADAEDATQEIFLTLWKRAARYDAQRGTESAFVATIAIRLLIDRNRAARRASCHASLDEVEDSLQTACHPHTERDLDGLRAASILHRLRPQQQQVLRLALWQDRSQREIATLIGMPLGTVKCHMRRGIQSMVRLLRSPTVPVAQGASKPVKLNVHPEAISRRIQNVVV